MLDATTGALLWRHAFTARAQFAVADGSIVVVDEEGVVTVLGTTGASLVPLPAFDTRYPGVGQEVRVDLGGSGAGAFGAATEFMADWGDGSETPWQESPVLTHRYATAEDAHARFFVRNAAGQTASVATTFHVGQKDPSVTLLTSPFSPEYQETSFFLLGLVATGAVAGFGIVRAGRKRRRLHRELRELEADFARLEPDAKACDAMLGQRKARARALFLQRDLEEAHASFLADRVDELRRSLRLSTVDAKLKFLPHGMVLHLQRLLADARVDAYERDHFLRALEAETSLTREQRAEVARLIDGWFARDAEARPAASGDEVLVRRVEATDR